MSIELAEMKRLASRLRQRVTIEQPEHEDDDCGGVERGWQSVATVWAEIVPLVAGAGEVWAGAQMEPRVTHQITIRYRQGMTAAMRVRFGERLFNIRSVRSIEERSIALSLLAEEGVAV